MKDPEPDLDPDLYKQLRIRIQTAQKPYGTANEASY
jgi:hypothetical protein